MVICSRLTCSVVASATVATLAAFAAGGCGESPDATNAHERLGVVSQNVTETCGATTTGAVQGVDVSDYQPNFDWVAAKVQFGYAQVSDGTGNPDTTFDANWTNMKKAHVLRGAYQFFRPAEDEVKQANMVIAKVGKLGPGDLPAMIDVEDMGGLSAAVVAAKVKHWLQLVESATGLRPFIYTGSYFWEDNVKDVTLGATPIWIAAYGVTCPSVPAGWKNWTFWQYSDGNTKLDHDVFNGTLAQLQAFSPHAATDAGAPDGGAQTDAGPKGDAAGPNETSGDAAAQMGGDQADAGDAPAEASGCNATSSRSDLGGAAVFCLAALAALMAQRARRPRPVRVARQTS